MYGGKHVLTIIKANILPFIGVIEARIVGQIIPYFIVVWGINWWVCYAI